MSAVSKKKSDKKDKIILNIQRTMCYIVLIIISILCLFSFYVLLINTTRSHPDIQKGFSLIPGKSFFVNLTNLLKDKQLPVLKGMCNSLLVASGSAVLSVYFSALTAYAIHAYDFRFKKAAFTFIMVIMMVPTQVSALGFINQMSNMRLMNSFIPLIIPSIASPVVFFFIPILIAQLRSADFLKFDMGKVYMMLGCAILPVIIVYLCLSKFIVRGVTLGGVKG